MTISYFQELGLDYTLTKPSEQVKSPDLQMEDESISGIKLMKKSVSLDRLYGQDLEIGGSSNISGTLKIFDTSNTQRVTLDASTGILVQDTSGDTVFQTDISGASLGDVSLGNFDGGRGLYYSNSGNSLTIRGTLNASSISASTITGGTITGTIISGGTISGTSITGGSITGTTLTGLTINGGTIIGATIILNQGGSGAGGDAFLEWSGGNQIWSDGGNHFGFLSKSDSQSFFFYANNSIIGLLQRDEPSANFYKGMAVSGADAQFQTNDGEHFIKGSGNNKLRFRGGSNPGQDTIEFWNPAGNTKEMSIHTGDGGKIFTEKDTINLSANDLWLNISGTGKTLQFSSEGKIDLKGHTLTLNHDFSN